MTYKNTLIGLITILAVCAAALLTLTNQSGSLTNHNDTQLPDAYMENVTAIILDKLGKVTLKIVTPKMVHYANNDTTNFTDPQLTLYHKSPNPWFIQSKTAKAWHGIDNVIFNDDVTIHHPADYNNPATVIKTTTLTVHPNQKTAETTEPITMIQPNSVMKAIGMQADMDSGNIKLLSQAQGEYVPESQ
jgi:lipopolysaccharide export system protein LptC